MAIRWNRIETWLTLGVAGVGLILLFVGGLWVYMSAMARPIHPDSQSMSSVAGGDPSKQWAAAVARARDIVRADVTERNIPGLSVAVGIDSDIVWAEGFGWADIEKKVAVAPTTRFRIGTASMPLTSAAAGVLVEQGKLKLDEKIQAYVPEFPEKPWPITLRQLMAHTAGLRSDSGDEGPLFGQLCDRPVEAIPLIGVDRDLRFEPGTAYYHSRYSFIPVSAAIEDAAGEPFLIFMRKAVFEPLGMSDTAADSPAAPPAEQTITYFPRFAGDPRYGPDVMRAVDLSCYAGASVFASTASDLVRFATRLDNKLLKPETVALLQTSQRLPSGQETGYGLGWDVETVTLSGQPTTVVGYDGDLLGGINSSLMVVRDRKLVVVILSNISYADTPSTALKIAEAFSSK